MTSQTRFHLDQKKFSELMLYIAYRCQNAERFGRTKLAKILYYCDFEAMRRVGQPITGASYVKESNGPLPEQFYNTWRSLVREQHAEVRNNLISDFYEERLIPTYAPVVLGETFSDQERSVIDEAIERLMDMNGRELSDFSHKEFGYEYGSYAEIIPYSTALLPRMDNPVFADWLRSRQA